MCIPPLSQQLFLSVLKTIGSPPHSAALLVSATQKKRQKSQSTWVATLVFFCAHAARKGQSRIFLPSLAFSLLSNESESVERASGKKGSTKGEREREREEAEEEEEKRRRRPGARN